MLAGVVNITRAAALDNVGDRLSNRTGEYTSGGAEECNGGNDELGEEHDCRKVMRDDVRIGRSWKSQRSLGRGRWFELTEPEVILYVLDMNFPRPTTDTHPQARPRMVFVRHSRDEKKSDESRPDSTCTEPLGAREVEEGCKSCVKLSTYPPSATVSPLATDANVSGADPTPPPGCVSSNCLRY